MVAGDVKRDYLSPAVALKEHSGGEAWESAHPAIGLTREAEATNHGMHSAVRVDAMK